MTPAGRLAHELGDELDPEQRAAVEHVGNTVVTAGPGSGKTRTLVARAAYTLAARAPAFRGVACITYTNTAADEIRRRLAVLGAPADRLVCSTVHGFCLTQIVRPYARLVGAPVPDPDKVVDGGMDISLFQRCLDQEGVGRQAEWTTAVATRIRRAVTAGTPTDSYDDGVVDAVAEYERLLADDGAVDFESMTSRALTMVRQSPHVRDLVASRFPFICVDEYQDLGGVLHRLVVELVDEAGVEVCAVGDPDQSVFGFAGATPQDMRELVDRDDFTEFPLTLNYRSGDAIVRASEAALGRRRGHHAQQGAPPGSVTILRADGGMAEHARLAVAEVKARIDDGVRPGRLAILYPKRGQLLDELRTQLDAAAIPSLVAKQEKLPTVPLSGLVQDLAAATLAYTEAHHTSVTPGTAPLLDVGGPAGKLRRLRLPDVNDRETPQETGRRVRDLVDPTPGPEADDPAGPWFAAVVRDLGLASAVPDQVAALVRYLGDADYQLQDIAAHTADLDRCLVTTYHSSKGLEFDTVVLPGLVDEFFPGSTPDGAGWSRHSGASLEEQRRLFFVAVSRAEREVVLIEGEQWTTAGGYTRRSAPTEFVDDIRQALAT